LPIFKTYPATKDRGPETDNWQNHLLFNCCCPFIGFTTTDRRRQTAAKEIQN